ncbi:MAG: hypothetical protein ACERIH_10180, partial [Labilibaculum antarcticum]
MNFVSPLLFRYIILAFSETSCTNLGNQKFVWRQAGATQAIKKLFGDKLYQFRQSKICLETGW